MLRAEAAAERVALAPGIDALPHGLLWIEATRSLVAADVHLGYEDAIGGVLPLWSTAGALEVLSAALGRTSARELVLLGDALHSSRLSEGAGRTVVAAIARLREQCDVTPIAGNHEGRSRGEALLGATFDAIVRDGWTLVHGDAPLRRGAKNVIGHLHPSLVLSRNESVPAFLCTRSLIVVPALTPYSTGLHVLSADCARALRAFDVDADDAAIVAATADRLYPFGTIARLRDALSAKSRR